MLNPILSYWEYSRLREGGEGSGNFDHHGRPGKVGGSSIDDSGLKWDIIYADKPISGDSIPVYSNKVDGNPTDNIKIRNKNTYDGPGDYMDHGSVFESKWGIKKHPGVEHVVDSVEQAISSYSQWLRDQFKQKGKIYSDLMEYASKFLLGKKINLICSCSPSPCHCDAIKDAIIGIAKKIVSTRVPAQKYGAQKWIKNL